jgi:antitoxin MazE
MVTVICVPNFRNLDKARAAAYLHCRYIKEAITLKTRVQKWGNSLALRIPKSFADEIGVRQNSSIELMVKDGELVVTPEREPKWRLEELLEKVTEDNIHHEWETGPAEGDETW